MIATTIEQSKHLLELGLNQKSADMCLTWCNNQWNEVCGKADEILHIQMSNYEDDWRDNKEAPKVIPAWSIGALLELVPPYLFEWSRGIDFNMYRNLNGKGWHTSYMPNNINDMQKDKFRQITNGDTPIEAVYNMIVWLLENNLIKR